MVGRAAGRTGGIDVIVRVHDLGRLEELGRAVFSAALQDYEPVTVVVVCQRFGAAGVAAVREALADTMAIVPQAGLEVLDWGGVGDGRAALMNLGLLAGRRRYCAFLDYDDVIYPEGYRLLVRELEESGAAIAFGGVLNAYVAMAGAAPYTTGKRRVFEGAGLPRLLLNNFCPIHSFVVDRERVAAGDLVVDETMGALEDYDLLLRLCARYRSSFRLKDKIVGEYLFKDDGSNVNPLANVDGQARWDVALGRIGALKDGLALCAEVQRDLGVDVPGLTVAGYLDKAGIIA